MLRGGSRAAATSKMERFVIIVSGFQLLTVITKCSILDVAAALDPSLMLCQEDRFKSQHLAKLVWHTKRGHRCNKCLSHNL